MLKEPADWRFEAMALPPGFAPDIKLNVEAQVVPRPAAKQTCLILPVSPGAKDAPVWQTLREIGRKTATQAKEDQL